MTSVKVISIDSITKLKEEHIGNVVVAGSHGGIYAGYCAAKGRVRAVILNDAGVGREQAGISSLGYLDALGVAAATADSHSCRIGNARDMESSGLISFVNRTAQALGCAPGQSVAACAERMRAAAQSTAPVPAQTEARFVARSNPGEPRVIVMDSVSLVQPSDAGAIVITASHGGLLGDDPATALRTEAIAAIFCDAGFGKERAGITRLPVLDRRGIAAATVSADSARIGDGRSVYADGVLSHVNDTAAAMGIRAGETVQLFIEKVIRQRQQR